MGHRPNLVSESGIVRLERCGCGTIHLHIGAMSMRLHTKDLFSLAHASSTALRMIAKAELSPEISPLADA